jgi:glycosyltransferase involved in cell wall biosynthesis
MSEEERLRFLTIANVPPDPNSGAAGTVYATNVALRELGHEVDEIWADQLGPRKIQHGNLHSLIEQPRAYRRAVLKAIGRKNYDVIVMNQPQAYLAAQALKAKGFRGVVLNQSHGVELRVNSVLPEWHRRLGVPESKFPRSLLTPVLRRLLERQWPLVASASDGVIVSSSLDREFLIENLGMAPSRVRVAVQGVNKDYVETTEASDSERRFQKLLYVGQNAFIKGVALLPQIISHVLAEHAEATFTIVTSAEGHASFRSAVDPSVLPRVRFESWMPQSELMRVYDSHGIFLFPSFFEGFGKAPFEAMARGLCVVASDEGGMHDLIQTGINGILCPRGDVQAMAAEIGRFLSTPDSQRRVSEQARKDARQLTWARCAAEFVDFARTLGAVKSFV